jgi:hypothetical protein
MTAGENRDTSIYRAGEEPKARSVRRADFGEFGAAVTTFRGRRSSGSGSTIQLTGEFGSTPRRLSLVRGTKSPRAEDLPARERVMRGNEEDPDGRDPVTVSQWKSEGEKWAMQNKRGDGPRVDGKIEMGRVGEKVDPSV